jgi:hypothetical protein
MAEGFSDKASNEYLCAPGLDELGGVPHGSRIYTGSVSFTEGLDSRICILSFPRRIKMENLICPLCMKKLSDRGMPIPGPGQVAGSMPINTLYCASCEMLVAPVAAPHVTDHASDNRGRVRSGGSNAGGSQRGDSSDQGASQWRTDPREAERNTWQDKN